MGLLFMRHFAFLTLNALLFRDGRSGKPQAWRETHGRLALRRLALALLMLAPFGLSSQMALAGANALRHEPRKILFLGTKFQNDHEGQEPTTDAERNRLHAIEEILKSQLESTGEFHFIPVATDIATKINEGQSIGECGGCEIDYGVRSGADISAWIVVQKVSNLILNINLYMIDVPGRKLMLSQSVDIRGNTDQSWTRGMSYLVKNHVIRREGIIDRN